jgi:hypothetical protein
MRVAARSLALTLSCAVPPLHAGQPLVTGDAAVVAYKTCQLEAWVVPSQNAREYWAQPACNFTGNLELSVGGARINPGDGPNSSAVVLGVPANCRHSSSSPIPIIPRCCESPAAGT